MSNHLQQMVDENVGLPCDWLGGQKSSPETYAMHAQATCISHIINEKTDKQEMQVADSGRAKLGARLVLLVRPA